MKMIEPSFMDDIDTDLCGDFFENIDDLLDFPIEDIEGGVTGGDCDGFQGLWSPPMDALPGGSGNVLSDKNSGHGTSELPTELSVPYEDIAQLEWLSNFVEDSFSAGSCTVEKYPYEENNKKKDSLCFQTSSPVSVLDSSSSCSGGKTMPLGPESFTHGRARSKRPRPATFSPRPVIPLISPTSSMTEPNTGYSASESPFEFESYAESRPSIKISNPIAMEQKKKKKRKLPTPAGAAEQSPAPPQAAAIRKCLHCEITKTPQWRAGPLGPKTLCNACGVRYKSGRLFPEYRPAASPTFVTSLHSNSHKKVIEMRNRATVAVPELVPNSSHLLDYI